MKLVKDDESIFIFDPTIFYMYLTQIEEEAENLRKRQEVYGVLISVVCVPVQCVARQCSPSYGCYGAHSSY